MQDQLQHHGIKGMRWGIRRYQNKDGTLTKRGKKRYAAEMEKLKEKEKVLKNKQRTQAKIDRLLKKDKDLDELEKSLDEKSKNPVVKKIQSKVKNDVKDKPKRIEDMTDEELAAKINRIRMEQTLKSLTAEQPKQVSKGNQLVKNLMKTVGEKTVANVSQVVADKAQKVLRDKLGLNDVDPLKKLERQAKKAELEEKIRKNKKDQILYEDWLKKREK